MHLCQFAKELNGIQNTNRREPAGEVGTFHQVQEVIVARHKVISVCFNCQVNDVFVVGIAGVANVVWNFRYMYAVRSDTAN